MTPDILTDAVAMAAKAVKAAIPSQAPTVAVSGVRKTAAGTRPVRGLLTAISSGSAFADPLGDSLGSSLKTISLIVPKCGEGGWFDETDPQEGDILTIEDGRKFAVTTVTETRGVYYKIEARQC